MSKTFIAAPKPQGLVIPAASAATPRIIFTRAMKPVYIPVNWPADSALYTAGIELDALRQAERETSEANARREFEKHYLAWSYASMKMNPDLMAEVAKYDNALSYAVRKYQQDKLVIKYKPKGQQGFNATNVANEPDEE